MLHLLCPNIINLIHIKEFISCSFFLGHPKNLQGTNMTLYHGAMGKPTSKPMLSCSFLSLIVFFFFCNYLSYLKDEASKQNPLFRSRFQYLSSNHWFSFYRNLRSAFNTRFWWRRRSKEGV